MSEERCDPKMSYPLQSCALPTELRSDTHIKLKRNTSIDAAKDDPVKKPKIRKPLDTRYEAPHSSLSESQAAFKLPSSVPYLSPSKFSPIPKSLQRTHRRTSSTHLKENASVLYSPFTGKGKRPHQLKKYGKAAKRANQKIVNSRNPSDSCSSSASSPISREDELDLTDNIHTSSISRSRISQSTANSPAESPTRIRRPSAPTSPSKSDWKNYMSTHTMSSAVDLRAPIVGYPESYFADSNDFIRPLPNHSQLNLNRPLSQLSLYNYNSGVTYNDNMEVDKVADRDAFFTDVQGTSTPFKNFGSLDVADRRFGATTSDPYEMPKEKEYKNSRDREAYGFQWGDDMKGKTPAVSSQSHFNSLRDNVVDLPPAFSESQDEGSSTSGPLSKQEEKY
ncbi:hypothetical protein F5050DRAFT_1905418 [Lentinula boryana]|uniref:Proteophosphoglycan ppg4 n=1 Tax=Lentinula boryana TaxID=40481 RepID=A0ABQ8Q1F3_9AGAR|nr:hypothetical protein F5050DRAFT_1905418 [Lentinula boryana]